MPCPCQRRHPSCGSHGSVQPPRRSERHCRRSPWQKDRSNRRSPPASFRFAPTAASAHPPTSAHAGQWRECSHPQSRRSTLCARSSRPAGFRRRGLHRRRRSSEREMMTATARATRATTDSNHTVWRCKKLRAQAGFSGAIFAMWYADCHGNRANACRSVRS